MPEESNNRQNQSTIAVLEDTESQLEYCDDDSHSLLSQFTHLINFDEAAKKQIEFVFCSDEGRLALLSLNEPNMAPLVVDFCSGKMAYRAAKVQQNREVICKAVGMKQNAFPSIVDATAGLGRDTFVLAAAGSNILALERSTVVYLLLRDGLNRTQHSELSSISERIQLQQRDARDWATDFASTNRNEEATSFPEVVYMDPMFPERKKSAAVKKEMQFFQRLLGFDPEPETLFELALSIATKRVVVKRPAKAPTITERKPTMQYTGKSARFDVYVVG